jgi:hypothetical protein
MAPLIGSGDRAGLEAAPNAITPTSDKAVERVGEEGGNKTEEYGNGGPRLGQFAKSGKDGTGANQNLGMAGEWLAHYEDGAWGTQRVGGLGIIREETGDSWIARGCKAQAVLLVAADEPVDGSVAQAAVAVVDDEEPVAELVRTELDGLVHLLRRMRAGGGQMQALRADGVGWSTWETAVGIL